MPCVEIYQAPQFPNGNAKSSSEPGIHKQDGNESQSLPLASLIAKYVAVYKVVLFFVFCFFKCKYIDSNMCYLTALKSGACRGV